jgi:DMSO/TMAO reductase YedYZ molybdopterin-dependent catalytic subunit
VTGTTRGFLRRNRTERDPRLPRGQHDIGRGWPVLSVEVTPRLHPEDCRVTVDGLVDEAMTWTWKELHELPAAAYTGDIHCVTSWSKLGTSFEGVSVDSLLDAVRVRPEGVFIVARSATGYTTNLPLADMVGGKAWIVWSHEGAPLSPEHGGPLRLLVPHLYFWKSAKWLNRLTVLDHDEPGFWEQNGYHNRGDPWLQQRYDGD